MGMESFAQDLFEYFLKYATAATQNNRKMKYEFEEREGTLSVKKYYLSAPAETLPTSLSWDKIRDTDIPKPLEFFADFCNYFVENKQKGTEYLSKLRLDIADSALNQNFNETYASSCHVANQKFLQLSKAPNTEAFKDEKIEILFYWQLLMKVCTENSKDISVSQFNIEIENQVAIPGSKKVITDDQLKQRGLAGTEKTVSLPVFFRSTRGESYWLDAIKISFLENDEKRGVYLDKITEDYCGEFFFSVKQALEKYPQHTLLILRALKSSRNDYIIKAISPPFSSLIEQLEPSTSEPISFLVPPIETPPSVTPAGLVAAFTEAGDSKAAKKAASSSNSGTSAPTGRLDTATPKAISTDGTDSLSTSPEDPDPASLASAAAPVLDKNQPANLRNGNSSGATPGKENKSFGSSERQAESASNGFLRLLPSFSWSSLGWNSNKQIQNGAAPKKNTSCFPMSLAFINSKVTLYLLTNLILFCALAETDHCTRILSEMWKDIISSLDPNANLHAFNRDEAEPFSDEFEDYSAGASTGLCVGFLNVGAGIGLAGYKGYQALKGPGSGPSRDKLVV